MHQSKFTIRLLSATAVLAALLPASYANGQVVSGVMTVTGAEMH